MADLSPDERAIAANADLKRMRDVVADAERKAAHAEAERRAASLEHLEGEDADPYSIAIANLLGAVEELARKAGIACDKSTPIGARIVKARAALSKV